MKTAFMILRRDLKRLLHNPVALVVVLGLVALPSLYAWYCIQSNWDPYGNTDGIKVAVVNNDKAVHSSAMGTVDVGSQIEDTLRENHNFTWEFVGREEAQAKLDEGYYFAAIVIPEDFSKDFLSVLSGKAKNPTIDYYVNEKYSAVATKVTDAGASTIERTISSTFVSTVSQAATKVAKSAAKDAGSKVKSARSGVSAQVEKVNTKLDTVRKDLKSTSKSIDGWRTTVSSASDTLDQVTSDIPALQQSLDNAQSDLKDVRLKANSLDTQFLGSLPTASLQLTKSSSDASRQLEESAATTKKIYGTTSTAASRLEALVQQNDRTISDLKALNRSGLSTVIAQLEDQNDKLRSAATSLRSTSNAIGKTGDGLYDASGQVSDAAQSGSQALTKTGTSFSQQVTPAVSSALDTYALVIGNLSATMDSLEPQVTQLKKLMGQMDDVLAQTQKTLNSTADSLSDTEDDLNNVVTDLDTIASSLQLQRLSSLTGLDPQDVGSFMSSPVKLDTQVVYPVEPYGSAVAPFYTNLALWIGCFMLIAVLRSETDREGFPDMTAKQAFLGRYLLMVLLAVLQSVLMLAGELVMGVQCGQPALFFLAGAVISFAYISIVYALAITLKHIGKALAVIILIFQIPGSSGMYPIEMMPPFFQALHPLLPFTYGIDVLRECIGGMYGAAYENGLAFLLVLVVPVALFTGLVLRKYLLNINLLFDNRLRETDVMDRESNGMPLRSSRYSIHNVVQALLNTDEYRQALFERAEKFNRAYPHIKRIGTLAVALLPILMIIVMSLFQVGSIDAKIIMLCAVLLAIVAVDSVLIFVEYMHDNLMYQLRVAEMDDNEFVDAMYRHISMGKEKAGGPTEEGAAGWRARSQKFRERFAHTLANARIELNGPSDAKGGDEGVPPDMATSVRSHQVIDDARENGNGPAGQKHESPDDSARTGRADR